MDNDVKQRVLRKKSTIFYHPILECASWANSLIQIYIKMYNLYGQIICEKSVNFLET